MTTPRASGPSFTTGSPQGATPVHRRPTSRSLEDYPQYNLAPLFLPCQLRSVPARWVSFTRQELYVLVQRYYRQHVLAPCSWQTEPILDQMLDYTLSDSNRYLRTLHDRFGNLQKADPEETTPIPRRIAPISYSKHLGHAQTRTYGHAVMHQSPVPSRLHKPNPIAHSVAETVANRWAWRGRESAFVLYQQRISLRSHPQPVPKCGALHRICCTQKRYDRKRLRQINVTSGQTIVLRNRVRVERYSYRRHPLHGGCFPKIIVLPLC